MRVPRFAAVTRCRSIAASVSAHITVPVGRQTLALRVYVGVLVMGWRPICAADVLMGINSDAIAP